MKEFSKTGQYLATERVWHLMFDSRCTFKLPITCSINVTKTYHKIAARTVLCDQDEFRYLNTRSNESADIVVM